jgi:hypothetical protein
VAKMMEIRRAKCSDTETSYETIDLKIEADLGEYNSELCQMACIQC